MFDEEEKPRKIKVLKKITKQRLKNITVYYLKRYETSVANMRRVLKKRVNDYAYQNKEFDKSEAYGWIEEILNDFQGYGYISDERFAEMRIRDYMASGKSVRYIQGKLREKGVDEQTVSRLMSEQEYDEFETALKLAKKKHIGPFRPDDETRREFRQKDMAVLARAGFSYNTAEKICSMEV